MFEIGDLVMLPAREYEGEVHGIIVGFDSETYGLKFYKIDWFDGETSVESTNNLIKVEING